MTPLAIMLIGTGINLMLVALLAGDKFVHKIAGATPLEARIVALEEMVADMNAKGSDDRTRYQRKFGELELDMREVKTVLRLREDTPDRGHWRGER